MSDRLSDVGARLVPRSHHHTLDVAFLEGIKVWCSLAGRDETEVEIYKVLDPQHGNGLIVVDDDDAAELHLVLSDTPVQNRPCAIALFMEELW